MKTIHNFQARAIARKLDHRPLAINHPLVLPVDDAIRTEKNAAIMKDLTRDPDILILVDQSPDLQGMRGLRAK